MYLDGVEIAIQIHCDAGGGILTKMGRIAQIGICGFSVKQLTDGAAMLSFDMVLMYNGRVTKFQGPQHLVTQGKRNRYFTVSTRSGCRNVF